MSRPKVMTAGVSAAVFQSQQPWCREPVYRIRFYRTGLLRPENGALSDDLTTKQNHSNQLKAWSLEAFARNTLGGSLFQFVLIAGLISLVAMSDVTSVGNYVNEIFGGIAGDVQTEAKEIACSSQGLTFDPNSNTCTGGTCLGDGGDWKFSNTSYTCESNGSCEINGGSWSSTATGGLCIAPESCSAANGGTWTNNGGKYSCESSSCKNNGGLWQYTTDGWSCTPPTSCPTGNWKQTDPNNLDSWTCNPPEGCTSSGVTWAYSSENKEWACSPTNPQTVLVSLSQVAPSSPQLPANLSYLCGQFGGTVVAGNNVCTISSITSVPISLDSSCQNLPGTLDSQGNCQVPFSLSNSPLTSQMTTLGNDLSTYINKVAPSLKTGSLSNAMCTSAGGSWYTNGSTKLCLASPVQAISAHKPSKTLAQSECKNQGGTLGSNANICNFPNSASSLCTNQGGTWIGTDPNNGTCTITTPSDNTTICAPAAATLESESCIATYTATSASSLCAAQSGTWNKSTNTCTAPGILVKSGYNTACKAINISNTSLPGYSLTGSVDANNVCQTTLNIPPAGLCTVQLGQTLTYTNNQPSCSQKITPNTFSLNSLCKQVGGIKSGPGSDATCNP